MSCSDCLRSGYDIISCEHCSKQCCEHCINVCSTCESHVCGVYSFGCQLCDATYCLDCRTVDEDNGENCRDCWQRENIEFDADYAEVVAAFPVCEVCTTHVTRVNKCGVCSRDVCYGHTCTVACVKCGTVGCGQCAFEHVC